MTEQEVRLALLRDFNALAKAPHMMLLIEFNGFAHMSEGIHIAIEARHGDGDMLCMQWWVVYTNGIRDQMGPQSTHKGARGATQSAMWSLKGLTVDNYMSELISEETAE